jgi:CDP-diacylglycerol--glycerol-3-phosphate 3-phosphatidyltransferase
VNLPNSITIGRIAAAPFVGWLPLAPSWGIRLLAFFLFLVVAISDYYDGKLARTRNSVTDLGKQLDPLADKLFLIATFVPMYALMNYSASVGSRLTLTGRVLPAYAGGGMGFVTPFGDVGLPLAVVIIVLGRELLMTALRQYAARKGVVIASIGPAKWKTGFQMTWVGAAYFWFWLATAAREHGWSSRTWTIVANANGLIGVLSMIGAVVLTVYSLGLYLRRYRYVFKS